MRTSRLSDSLQHKERKLLRPEVFPEPLLALQIQIKPPHENLHVPPPLYDSTLCAPHPRFKGKRLHFLDLFAGSQKAAET
jgi:hypothetical protein